MIANKFQNISDADCQKSHYKYFDTGIEQIILIKTKKN